MTYDEAIEQVRSGKAVRRPEWPPELIIVLENSKRPVKDMVDANAILE